MGNPQWAKAIVSPATAKNDGEGWRYLINEKKVILIGR